MAAAAEGLARLGAAKELREVWDRLLTGLLGRVSLAPSPLPGSSRSLDTPVAPEAGDGDAWETAATVEDMGHAGVHHHHHHTPTNDANVDANASGSSGRSSGSGTAVPRRQREQGELLGTLLQLLRSYLAEGEPSASVVRAALLGGMDVVGLLDVAEGDDAKASLLCVALRDLGGDLLPPAAAASAARRAGGDSCVGDTSALDDPVQAVASELQQQQQ